MTPVIKHLRSTYLNLPAVAEQPTWTWSFAKSAMELAPEHYSRLVVMHPVLNIEYSVLCNQIRHNLSFPEQVTQEQLIEQLAAALMLAELLEHLHCHYLIVPREVARLRRHQTVYRSLLTDIAGYSFPTPAEHVEVGLSVSQYVRDNTALTNWFRLLITRSKRVLNFLELIGTGSESYSNFVRLLDDYTNPIFAYVAWCFFIPRFLMNLFLLFKHSIPGFWMGQEEADLGWWIRFEAQIKRRWFELGNDVVWIAVGLLNCFLLIGPLAPLSVYCTLFAFAFDIVNTCLRTYIELNRLFTLQEEYNALWRAEADEVGKKTIRDYQSHLASRIEFEKLRLGLSTANCVAVFIAMSLAVPVLVSTPVVPFISALFLIAIWIVSYTLTQVLEQYRPNDVVEKPPSVSKTGFFARKEPAPDTEVARDTMSDPHNSNRCEYSFCL